MEPIAFFSQSNTPRQKQYEALRAFYLEKHSAKDVAARFGYTLSTFYSLTKEFRATLSQENPAAHYFIHPQLGLKPKFEGTLSDAESESVVHRVDSGEEVGDFGRSEEGDWVGGAAGEGTGKAYTIESAIGRKGVEVFDLYPYRVVVTFC